MEVAIEQYLNGLCECGCSTFQINTLCLLINENFIDIN